MGSEVARVWTMIGCMDVSLQIKNYKNNEFFFILKKNIVS